MRTVMHWKDQPSSSLGPVVWNCRQMCINLEISVQFSSCSTVSVQPNMWKGRKRNQNDCILEYMGINRIFLCSSWRSIDRYEGRAETHLELERRAGGYAFVFYWEQKMCMRFEKNCLELFYTLSTLEVTLSETWNTWEENFASYVSGRQIMHVQWIYLWDGEEKRYPMDD